MSRESIGFDLRSVRRVSNATRYVEGLPQYKSRAGYGTGPGARGAAATGTPVVGRVDSVAAGSGKYMGYAGAVPDNDITADSDLSLADLGFSEDLLAGSPNALLLNAQEYGFDGSHDLVDPDNVNELNFVGFILRVNTDGLLVVVITAMWRGC